jgi:hypothetical protein
MCISADRGAAQELSTGQGSEQTMILFDDPRDSTIPGRLPFGLGVGDGFRPQFGEGDILGGTEAAHSDGADDLAVLP